VLVSRHCGVAYIISASRGGMFKIFTRSIDSQIDEFLSWRRERITTFSDAERSCIERFVSLNSIQDVGEISMNHVLKFQELLREQYASNYLIESSMRNLRCFLRYFHARGYPCVSAAAVLRLSTPFRK